MKILRPTNASFRWFVRLLGHDPTPRPICPLILNRIAPTIEQNLIKEHAGFRPGKSCTSQMLNLTQYIEDVYQESMITETAFVDLSAAYDDIVNHILLIQKLYNTIQDSALCRVIQILLSNRRLYVELNNEQSRLILQKNGLYW